MTDPTDLRRLADELLSQASEAPARRAAHTIVGGSEHALRQTLVALLSGSTLDEHENPGEATLHVLRGQVDLHSGGSSATVGEGQVAPIPQARHSLTAVADSVVLLTVAKV